MRSKLAVAVLGAVLCVSLIGATGASAATEVGNRCTVDETTAASTTGAVAVSLANAPGNPLPAAIPSAGVITRWTFSISIPNETGTTITETLKVFRPTGVPQQLQVVGESAPAVITGGTQAFPTRIPVKAGDLVGALAAVGGATGAIFCKTEVPGDAVGMVAGTVPTGSTSTIAAEEGGHQNPIVVSVEPDADNDGFGDETQDQCPQNATTQAACPVRPLSPVVPAVALSAFAIAKGGLATVLVTSSTQTPVTVAGTTNLGKGKTAKLNGGTQIVAPGALARFTLLFPKKLRDKLKQLSPKQKLTLNLTAKAVNASGQPSTTTLKVRVKGQAKPKPQKRRGQAKS